MEDPAGRLETPRPDPRSGGSIGFNGDERRLKLDKVFAADLGTDFGTAFCLKQVGIAFFAQH